MNDYLVVVGTRPEIIKMAPVVWAMERRGVPFQVFFTGQHFDEGMGIRFLKEFGYPPVRTVVAPKLGEQWKAESTLTGLLELLRESKAALALGDTHTVALTALAAVMTATPFFHIESGLRCGDRRMLEERYRTIADVAASKLFIPLRYQFEHVRDCLGEKYLVGNTIADVLKDLTAVEKSDRVFITLHRRELTEDVGLFVGVLQSIANWLEDNELTGVYPVHPSAARRLSSGVVNKLSQIKFVRPYTARQTWDCIRRSRYVMTDSGGVQEEACILGTPCCIIRDNTERRETITIGAAALCPPAQVVATRSVIFRRALSEEWQHPYGEDVGEKIVDIILMG